LKIGLCSFEAETQAWPSRFAFIYALHVKIWKIL